jgi:hypothetical protein
MAVKIQWVDSGLQTKGEEGFPYAGEVERICQEFNNNLKALDQWDVKVHRIPGRIRRADIRSLCYKWVLKEPSFRWSNKGSVKRHAESACEEDDQSIYKIQILGEGGVLWFKLYSWSDLCEGAYRE